MKEGNGLHSGGEKVWGRNPFESAENFGKEDDEKEAGSEIQREAGHDLPVSSGPRPRLAPTIAVYLAFFACVSSSENWNINYCLKNDETRKLHRKVQQ